MEPPELYVRQNPMPNAYTLAISGHKPFIVIHTALLELLTLPELQAVIAHGEYDSTTATKFEQLQGKQLLLIHMLMTHGWVVMLYH